MSAVTSSMAGALLKLLTRCRKQHLLTSSGTECSRFSCLQTASLQSLISLTEIISLSCWNVADPLRDPLSVHDRRRCGATCARLFASRSGDAAPVRLQTRIRQLLMMVHPDRWVHDPAAQKENERSFKLLQEYMAVAKAGSHGAAAGPGYKFVFFLHPQTEGSSDGFELTEEPPKRITVTLPPPARHQGATGDELPQTTSIALAKLLNACGLDSDFSGGLGGMSGSSQRLVTFLPQAAEQARQAQHQGAHVQLDIMRSALRMSRQCTVALDPSLRRQSHVRQLGAMQQLASLLDSVDADVSGVQFMIGERNSIDHVGRVWLDIRSSAADWHRHLQSVDLRKCRRVQEQLQRVRRLEDQTAQKAQLSTFFAEDDRLAVQPEYTEFLCRIAASCVGGGVVAGGAFQQLPVRIQRSGFQTDQHSGLVAVQVSASAPEVRDYIQAHGHGVVRLITERRQQQKDLGRLRDRVKSLLRLRRLSIDPALESHQAASCLQRLAHHHAALSTAADGLSLRVSHNNLISPDGSHTDVAWNFEL